MPPRNQQPAKISEKAVETTLAKESKPGAKSMAAMRNDRGKLNEQKNSNNTAELSSHKKNNKPGGLTNENDKKLPQKQSDRKIEVNDIAEDPRQTEQDERREKPLESVNQSEQLITKLEQSSNDNPIGEIVTSKEREELGRGIRVIIQRSPEIDNDIEDTLKRLLECQKHRQVLQMQELGINRRSQELWVRLKRQPGHNPWVNRDPRMSFKIRKWPSKIKGSLRDHLDQIDELIIDEEESSRSMKYKEENPIISIDFSDFQTKREKPNSSMKLKEMKEYIMMNKLLKEEEQNQVLICLQDQIMSFLTVTDLVQFYQLHKKFDVLRIILVRENYDNLSDMETLLRESYEEDIWKENNAKAVKTLLNENLVNQPSNQSIHKLLNKTLHVKEDASFPEFQMADPTKKAKSIKCENEHNKMGDESSETRKYKSLDGNKEKIGEFKIDENQTINASVECKDNEADDIQ